ncbi:uncharacterized protein BKA78DRAFT_53901 [Phyllosticta capitalensis]|uniref:uncharacterized protein n=1 Tax=Phyllosticta capitalensis TaxID=121624 RepID=UPI0031308433
MGAPSPEDIGDTGAIPYTPSFRCCCFLQTFSPALRRVTGFHGLTNKVDSFLFFSPSQCSLGCPRTTALAQLRGFQRSSILGYGDKFRSDMYTVKYQLVSRRGIFPCIIKDQYRDSRAAADSDPKHPQFSKLNTKLCKYPAVPAIEMLPCVYNWPVCSRQSLHWRRGLKAESTICASASTYGCVVPHEQKPPCLEQTRRARLLPSKDRRTKQARSLSLSLSLSDGMISR